MELHLGYSGVNEINYYFLKTFFWASLIAQLVKNPPAIWKTLV